MVILIGRIHIKNIENKRQEKNIQGHRHVEGCNKK